MKKLFLAVLMIIFLCSLASALMPPKYKECLQRGYEVSDSNEKTYCVFPDGSNCSLEAFNNGSCGEEFMTEDYCVEAGDPVWEEGICCEGSEKHLEEGKLGQPRCKKIETPKDSETTSEEPETTRAFWPIYAVSAILVIAGIIIWLKRKKVF